MPNQPQSRSPQFGRYIQQTVNPVPAGYMEAVASEANMYANLGQTIAGSINRYMDMQMKEKEFGLKEREIETAGKAADASAIKGLNESRKLDIAEQEAATKEAARIAAERTNSLQAGIKAVGEEIGYIKMQLDKPEEYGLDAAKIAELKARRNALLQRNGELTDSYMKIVTGGSEAPKKQTPAQRYLSEWDKLPPGTRLPFNKYDENRRREEGLLPKLSKPNPNQASEPANGGSEAAARAGEVFLPGIPKAIKAHVAAGVPVPVSNPPTNSPVGSTVNGVPSTITPGQPDFSAYHLKMDARNDKEIPLQSGGIAPVSFFPKKDQTTGDIVGIGINVAPALMKSDDPQTAIDNLRQIRIGHVMKFIMDNNLAESIKTTEEERAVATKMFGTVENAPIMGKIYKAWALINRDQTEEAVNTPEFLGLNRLFESKYGFNIDRFINEGWENNDNKIVASPLPTLRELHSASIQRQTAIAQKAREMLTVPTEFAKDPTQEERDRATKLLEKVRQNLAGVPAGSSYAEMLKREESSLESQLRENKIKFETWKARYDMWEGKSRLYNDLIKSEAAIGEGLAVQISAARATKEFAEAAEPQIARMVGASKADAGRFGGWKAPGVVDFPRLQVVEGNTTRFLTAPEWLSYIRRTQSWEQVAPVVASLQERGRIPDETQMKAIVTVQNEHDKLIPALQGLASRFYAMSKLNYAERVARQKLDEEFAAAGPLRLSVMAALRVSYTGGGNPSNFEQEMLLSAIPAPDEALSVTNFGLQRIRLIAVLSMLNHAKTMVQNNLGAISDEVIDNYNRQYEPIFGRKITLKDFEDFMNAEGIVSGRNMYEGTAGMSDRADRLRPSVTAALLGLNNIIERKFK